MEKVIKPLKENHIMHDKAVKWAHKILKSLGYPPQENMLEIVQHTPWSYVAQFNTSEGYIYLKQTPPAIALEAKISQVLHENFDAPTPIIIASNVKLNCFLMEDAGLSLRVVLKKKFDKELVCSAIDQFTSLQLAVSERVGTILDIGVPDWRLENFPNLYREVISDKELLMNDGLSEIEIDEVEALVPKISTLCEQLLSYSIKQTIVQPDCNDNNMLIDDTSKTITIIDLGELVISHPFFSLLNFLHIIKIHHSLKEDDKTYVELKNASLKPYIIFESEENISDAFLIAQELWFVYGVLAHYRLMLACGKEKIVSWQKGKFSSLFRAFMANGR